VQSFATWPGVNWSRSSSFWGMPQF
jgi:hypothetical protein